MIQLAGAVVGREQTTEARQRSSDCTPTVLDARCSRNRAANRMRKVVPKAKSHSSSSMTTVVYNYAVYYASQLTLPPGKDRRVWRQRTHAHAQLRRVSARA